MSLGLPKKGDTFESVMYDGPENYEYNMIHEYFYKKKSSGDHVKLKDEITFGTDVLCKVLDVIIDNSSGGWKITVKFEVV